MTKETHGHSGSMPYVACNSEGLVAGWFVMPLLNF